MEIRGKKVILRQWRQSDAKQLRLLTGDKSIAMFTTIPSPYTPKHAREFIKKAGKNFRQKKEYCFAITEKNGCEMVGGISIIRMEPKSKKAEFGYWLGKKHRKKGYMAESVKLLLEFAFGKLKLNRVKICCSTKNRASRKVIEKAGAKFEGIEREGIISGLGKKHDTRVYSILKSEFKRKAFFPKAFFPQKKRLKRKDI